MSLIPASDSNLVIDIITFFQQMNVIMTIDEYSIILTHNTIIAKPWAYFRDRCSLYVNDNFFPVIENTKQLCRFEKNA